MRTLDILPMWGTRSVRDPDGWGMYYFISCIFRWHGVCSLPSLPSSSRGRAYSFLYQLQLGKTFIIYMYVQGGLHLPPPPLFPLLLSRLPPCSQREGINYPVEVEDMT
jgi:hypothetical protein